MSDKNIQMQFSQRLQMLRKKKGVSQAEVAKHIGLTVAAYQNYENGRREASYETLNKLSNFFNVSIDYLFGRAEAPNPVKQITNEELEQKLVEGYFAMPKERREEFLNGLRQTVANCYGLTVEQLEKINEGEIRLYEKKLADEFDVSENADESNDCSEPNEKTGA